MSPTAKIMVVDDEKQICHNAEKILSKYDFEVTYALSAKEAIKKMAEEPYALLITDILMPEMDGLELLEYVKKEWPQTKTIMMTAFASIDSAVKAIQMGALDYIPKPFTPNELRSTVKQVMGGEIIEFPKTASAEQNGHAIDVDIPFDRKEVAKYTGEDYVDRLTSSDIPQVETQSEKPPENYCEMGARVCDIYKKLGDTCKGGIKKNECPQKTAQKRKKGAKAKEGDPQKLIGIDLPFNYQEVKAVTGPEYIRNLHHEGVAFLPYEELKKNVAQMLRKEQEDVRSESDQVPGSAAGEILIIDDEVAVSNNIRKILLKSEPDIDQAITKKEALDHIGAKSYKLVVLDLRIPGVKGLELLERIRNEQPEAKVVIVTGYASIESAVEATRLGANAYLPKPFTPQELRDVTQEVLQKAA